MLTEFKTAKGERLDTEDLIEALENFILADKRYEYRVLVGTDSECFDHQIDFITVIVIHRVGHGARYFWKRQIIKSQFSLSQRLWQEALFSLSVSQDLLKILTGKGLNFRFEFHLDLGNVGKSSSSIKEIINLIRGYGFEVKVKPESYAASKIADRLL